MKHLKLFKTQAEFDAATLELPSVNYIVENDTVNFHMYVDYKLQYLTFEAIEDSTFSLTQNACEYSLDEGETWTSLSVDANTPTVPAGGKIMFKATNPSIFDELGIGTFSSTGKFTVEGNIMSMLYGDDFVDKNDLTGKSYAFYGLFAGCTNVVEAHNLILPATVLSNFCYAYMFESCTSLTQAPKLPATTLVDCCYEGMFWGCTSLTQAPELSATTLSASCCYYMFSSCKSLTTAPELPATTLADSCYSSMFYDCTGLTTAPKLPATTLAASCYSEMFSLCTSLTTAPELPATTLNNGCYAYMFQDCTSLTTTPELPATKLARECYYGMFQGCSNLNYIKMLATDITANNCLIDWVYGVASTGTFIKHPDMASLPSGSSGIPDGWTVEDYGETNDPYNGHEYVDLGLPSGTLWATCNIGATTPEEHGDHFNWGETSPTTQMNDVCVTYDLSIDELKSRGIIDNNGRLTAEYDAATVTWGSDWRMPTRSEMQELLDNCTCQYTSTPPYLFQIVGPNGNSITMPNTHIAGGGGHYWSSDVSDYDSQAYELFFTGSYQYTESCDRAMENTIRPVRNN